MKRLTIRVNDSDTTVRDWIKKQNNLSASVRLLIQQAARLDSNDYVMHCASQVGTPVEQQSGQALQPVNRSIEAVDVVEPSTESVDNRIESADTVQADAEPVDRTTVASNEQSVDDHAESTDRVDLNAQPDVDIQREPEQPAPVMNTTITNNEDDDDDDTDDDSNLTNRLLSDIRRPRSGSNLGSSFEGMMIQESQNDRNNG